MIFYTIVFPHCIQDDTLSLVGAAKGFIDLVSTCRESDVQKSRVQYLYTFGTLSHIKYVWSLYFFKYCDDSITPFFSTKKM